MTYEDCKRISDALWEQTNLTTEDIQDVVVACEKRISRKPNCLTYDEVEFVDEREDTVLYPHCGDCGTPLDVDIDNYCPVCGKSIDWSEVEE